MEEDKEQMMDSQALLDAISRNSECAHVLAAIADGGDARELIKTLLDDTDSDQPNETPEIAKQEDLTDGPAEVPMFTTPTQKITSASEPVIILDNVEPDFWDF